MMRRRILGVLGLAASVVGLAVWSPVAATAAGGSGVPVKVTFDGTGQYTVDETYTASGGSCTTHDVWTLHWSSSFETALDNGVLQGATGQLTSGSPGTATMTVGGICATYDPNKGGPVVPSCGSPLSSPANAPALKVSGSDPERVEAQSIASGISPSCSDATDGPFIGRDTYFFDQAVPDAMSAVADIPSTQLSPGSSVAVSSGNAPGQVVSDCTGQGPAAGTNTACSASLTWDGTITISCVTPIGKVTFSEGGALPVGTEICDGQTVRTGNGRMEITLNDGSIMRLGPHSEATISQDTEVPSHPITVHLVLGVIWAKFLDLTGNRNTYVEHGTDAAGTRGCEFTAAVASGGGLVLHVVQGTGFYMTGRTQHTFPAGDTLTLHGARHSLSPVWPVVQRSLVPAAGFPPALTAVKLSGRNLGAAARLHLKLSEAATLAVQVMRGTRVLASFRAAGHRGANALRLRHAALKPGRYTLRITATHNRLVSLAQLSVKLR